MGARRPLPPAWAEGRRRRRRGWAQRKAREFFKGVLDLAGEYGRSPALRGFATALWSAAPCLFLFVEVPGVAPTNNPAEEPLREPVVVRKIRGSLRSVRSVMAVCALWACIGAWKRRGPDPMAELAKFV